MNRRLLVIAVVAFVVSLGVTYVAYRVARRQLAGQRLQKNPQVVVAGHDIGVGTVLRAQDLSYSDWPGSLAKGMSAKAETLIGRGVVAPLFSGEPVIESRLAATGSGGGLASTIPPGMRACAVKVNDVVGVAGFVTPGMRVDVLIASTQNGAVFGIAGPGNFGTKVKTLLQNLEVLSAGTDIQRDLQGKPSQVQVVNLLVTPDQAEVLSLANTEARIQLVLRNPMDTKIAQTSGAQMSRLFAEGEAPVLPKPAVAAPAGASRRRRQSTGAIPAPAPVPLATEVRTPPAVVEVIYGARRAGSEGGK